MLLGKCNVRSEILVLLSDSLNKNIVPLIPSPSSGKCLVNFIIGEGSCVFNHNVINVSEAFQECGIQPIRDQPLTNEEIYVLTNYPFIELGLGCLLANGSLKLLNVSDCIVSLSCEAVGASVLDAFDSNNFEISRQQRGQMVSATNLRSLLEGSKRVSSHTSMSVDLPKDTIDLLRSSPQVIGPCLESVTGANRVLDIELNSSESGNINYIKLIIFYTLLM